MGWINTNIEVRYQETDQMRVVYHANYLVWFEIGRTKFIEHLGFKYAEMEDNDVLSPVINANISYKLPVRYGETVLIKTRLKHYDGIRVKYEYQVIKENSQLAVKGETEHVFVKKDTFKPLIIRKINRKWHEAFSEIKGGN